MVGRARSRRAVTTSPSMDLGVAASSTSLIDDTTTSRPSSMAAARRVMKRASRGIFVSCASRIARARSVETSGSMPYHRTKGML